MSYTSDTLQCILNIKQTQINVLVIQCQTHLGKIFKCTIFVGYGGVINFERCRTVSSCLQVYQVSLKNLEWFSSYRADTICDGQTDRQTDGQTHGEKQYVSLPCRGET